MVKGLTCSLFRVQGFKDLLIEYSILNSVSDLD